MPLYDMLCHDCEHVEVDAWRKCNEWGACESCGSANVKPRPALFGTDCWGGPKYVSSLDREFDSRSDLKKFLKEHNFSEAGDRVGGARDENKKRIYSYSGQSKH